MEGHFLGQDRNSGGASSTRGSSLAVRQFVDLARGDMPVHAPNQPWQVESVIDVEGYCLRCCDVRIFDVVSGRGRAVAFCRACGLEVAA